MVDEQKLRKLAEAATPGPWITEGWASKDSDGAINVCGTSVMAPQALCAIFTVALEGDATEDVEYIATANPAAILSLLDELQTLREERTAWRVTAENAEALVADLRKQNEAQKDEWLSWAAKRDGLEKDAARYAQVRRGQRWSVVDGIGNLLRGDDLDAAADQAIKVAMKDES